MVTKEGVPEEDNNKTRRRRPVFDGKKEKKSEMTAPRVCAG